MTVGLGSVELSMVKLIPEDTGRFRNYRTATSTVDNPTELSSQKNLPVDQGGRMPTYVMSY